MKMPQPSAVLFVIADSKFSKALSAFSLIHVQLTLKVVFELFFGEVSGAQTTNIQRRSVLVDPEGITSANEEKTSRKGNLLSLTWIILGSMKTEVNCN